MRITDCSSQSLVPWSHFLLCLLYPELCWLGYLVLPASLSTNPAPVSPLWSVHLPLACEGLDGPTLLTQSFLHAVPSALNALPLHKFHPFPSFFFYIIYIFLNFYLLEGETLICFSTYLCIHWLILLCALTGDRTCIRCVWTML